jgi:hypothetical protein
MDVGSIAKILIEAKTVATPISFKSWELKFEGGRMQNLLNSLEKRGFHRENLPVHP